MVRGVACALAIAAIAACGAPDLTFRDDELMGGAGGAGGASGSSVASGGTVGSDGSSSGGSPGIDASLGDVLSGADRTGPDAGCTTPGSGACRADGGGASCTNGILDGDESDVDCGGVVCARCTVGGLCKQDTDCNSAYCKQGICAQGSCIDRVRNLKETDVDCGGGDCPPCGVGASCVSFTDCAQQSCIAGRCQSLSCDDRILGPGETDVDCGGPSCAPCAQSKRCLLPRDCSSNVCSLLICTAPSCADGIQNGTETAKDCGGGCAPCADGMGCVGSGDCASSVCSGRICQTPSCTDKVKNHGESDVDCGGPCGKCPKGSVCGGDADCSSSNCAGTCQPCPRDMVGVPAAGGGYCIDALEVTVSRYSSFLMTNPPMSLLPASCAGKTSFAPSTALDLSKPTNPVAYVDWCDAYAYCANFGRHLCGRIGGGATLSLAEQNDATKSEWHNACSKGGAQAYPYGDTYRLGMCVDRLGTNGPRPVGSAAGCVGGYAGLHDMSGNVQEWEDNCVVMPGMPASVQDQCKTRGGSYNDNQGGALCATTTSTRKRNQADAATGFRCCL